MRRVAPGPAKHRHIPARRRFCHPQGLGRLLHEAIYDRKLSCMLDHGEVTSAQARDLHRAPHMALIWPELSCWSNMFRFGWDSFPISFQKINILKRKFLNENTSSGWSAFYISATFDG